MTTTKLALIALTLVLAACGSGAETDTASEESAATTTASAAGTATTEPAVVEDEPSEEPVATTETTAPPASTPAGAAEPAGFSLFDFRYCEILLTVVGEDGADVTEVWGTPGVDPCTDEAWYALDPDAIRAENDASFIEMNGPRYFVVDGTADTGDGTVGVGTASGGAAIPRQFGDLTMTLLTTTEVTAESETYEPDLVERTTTWTFEAGTEVYELIDPEGHVYTMQSYSRIEDRSLTAADLPTLGERLDLPVGWTFQTRVLDSPYQVPLAPEGAYVVQDDLRNSYQRNG